jgi:hypothetical protein
VEGIGRNMLRNKNDEADKVCCSRYEDTRDTRCHRKCHYAVTKHFLESEQNNLQEAGAGKIYPEEFSSRKSPEVESDIFDTGALNR